MAGVSLTGLTVQNLRLFTDTHLDLSNGCTYLIGPNNSGKTSLLALLDLVFNRDLLPDFARATDELLSDLKPARDTRNQARRLTLWVQVDDRRRHKRFQCHQGVAQLRLSLTLSDRRFRANLGQARRGEQHDVEAVHLLDELRRQYAFVHIPAGRSVDSMDFGDALDAALQSALIGVFDKPGKGATAEERKVKNLIDTDLAAIAQPAHDFWTGFLERLPAGWVKQGDAKPAIDKRALAAILVEQLAVKLTTGEHDAAGVGPAAVGSGLQSLLDIELRRYVAEQSGRQLILAIEEPEVFLHPSAQRRLGRDLARSSSISKLLVSTHSALVVEEAPYESIALVRDQTVHQPTETDPDRVAINTFLAAGRGAEMYFARSVLFVEGPGDREYWEGLRRRLAGHDDTGAVDHCYVVETGGNEQFAPWIRLVRSFAGDPIRWVALMDSDSAPKAIACAAAAGVALTNRQQTLLNTIAGAWGQKDTVAAGQAARQLSQRHPDEERLWLAPGDLEQVMCASLSDATVARLAAKVGLTSADSVALAEDLGTNCRVGHTAKNVHVKAPWVRRLLAEETPGDEISPFAARVLEEWLHLAGVSARAASRTVNALRASS